MTRQSLGAPGAREPRVRSASDAFGSRINAFVGKSQRRTNIAPIVNPVEQKPGA